MPVFHFNFNVLVGNSTFIKLWSVSVIDSASTVELVDNLEFQKFKIKIELPNKMVLNLVMFSRLFNKKELSVNIMYVDNEKGTQMLNAWKNSKFRK